MPAPDNDGPEPLYCVTCDSRAAKPVEGPPLCLFCINCAPAPIFEMPADPELRGYVFHLLGVK